MKKTNSIILTGPPRSGTTLACFLLNKLPNVVALHEPMNLKMFPSPETGLMAIDEFFPKMRQSLLSEKQALSKASGSHIPDNPFKHTSGALRKSIVQKEWVSFDKPLDSDFQLVIKQNAHFTFLLDRLIQSYTCATILRNPVSVIASWNTIDAPVAKGNLTVLKGLSPQLYHEIEQIPDILDRQVRLLHELFLRYLDLPELIVVRYEDIIESGGSALKKILPQAEALSEDLLSKNRNSLYRLEEISRIKERLLAFDGAYLKFYSTEQINQI